MLARVATSRHRVSVVSGRRAVIALLVPLYLLGSYVGISSWREATGLSEAWPVLTGMFVLLTYVWPISDDSSSAAPQTTVPQTTVPRTAVPQTAVLRTAVLRTAVPRTAVFWGTAATLVLGFVAAGVLAGGSVLWLLWIGGGNLAAAILLGVIYRARARQPSWAPYTPRELIWLLFASVVVSVVVTLIAAVPGTDLFGTSVKQLVWWSIRCLAYVAAGSAMLLVICHWRRTSVLRLRSPWQLVLVLPLFGVFLYVPYQYPLLPLSWMLLLPAIWAGLIMPPVSAALIGFGVAVWSAVAAVAGFEGFGYTEAWLAPSVIIDLLLVLSTYLSILLTLFRDERSRLIIALERQRTALDVQRDRAEANSRVLLTAFEAMSDGVVLADWGGEITLSNRAARSLLGRTISGSPESWSRLLGLRRLDGRSFTDPELAHDFFPPDGGVATVDLSLDRPGGGPPIFLESSSRMVQTDDGPKLMVLFRDVTAVHERHQELKSFARTISHDLKGPLTTAVAWTDLVQSALRTGDMEQAEQGVSQFRQATMRMSRMIDDWLLYTVAREGMLRVEDIDLEALVADVVELFETGQERAPVFWLDVTDTVRADRALVTQLLSNLIGNAVKYAVPGEQAYVKVTSRPGICRPVGAQDQGWVENRCLDEGCVEDGWVEVAVADRGVGIAPGDEERIFGTFERGSDDATTQYDGTGLGLALCHSVVTRHGGRISAERNADGGTTIRFTLPAAETSPRT